MTQGDPADYIAAAIAYALINYKLPTSSDVRKDFVSLLNKQFDILLPREAIVPALRILSNEGIIIMHDDRYFPLVDVPIDLGSRIATWRFLDKRTSAGEIFHRFSDGPYDWMKTVLQSGSFLRDLKGHYPQSGLVLEPPPNGMQSSEDKRTQNDVQASAEQARMAPSVAVNISNVIASAGIGDDALARSAKSAGWFGGWGTWAGALLAAASIVVALYIAGKI